MRATEGVRALVCECLHVCEQARKLPTDLLVRLRRYLYFKQVGDLRCRNMVQRVATQSIRLVSGLRSPSSPSRYTHAPKRPPLRMAVHRFRLPQLCFKLCVSVLAAMAHLGMAARAVLISCALAARSRPARAEWRQAWMASGAVKRMGSLVRAGPDRGGTCCGIRR